MKKLITKSLVTIFAALVDGIASADLVNVDLNYNYNYNYNYNGIWHGNEHTDITEGATRWQVSARFPTGR